MNLDDPIATLFPGAAGRTVAELTRRHGRGEQEVDVAVVAAGAAVVRDQVVKVATRLALLGMVDFPVTERVSLVREHLTWTALARLADVQDLLDELVARSAYAVKGVAEVFVAGPVPAATARAFHEGTEVAVVARFGSVADSVRQEVAARISRATGNACTVVVTTDADEARRLLPPDGLRVLDARPAGAGGPIGPGDL